MSVQRPGVRILDWASSGSKSDPGASAELAGFNTGDRPPPNWLNWIFGGFGDRLRYFDDTTRPWQVARALKEDGSTPFGTDIFRLGIVWEPTQKKFYATVVENTTFDVKVYESTDGLSWSAGVTVNLNDTTSGNNLNVAYCPDNNRIGVGSETSFFLSTSDSVSGFSTTPTGVFNSVFVPRGLTWDDTNKLWLVAGQSTGGLQGRINSAAASGVVWTERFTTTLSPGNMANNRAGTTVVPFSGTDNIYYSTNGTAWNRQATGPSKAFQDAFWCPFANRFIATVVTENLVYWSNTGAAWADTGWPAVDTVIVCEDFVVFITETDKQAYLVSSASGVDGSTRPINLEIDLSAAALDPAYGDYLGGPKAFSYINGNDKLVNCTI